MVDAPASSGDASGDAMQTLAEIVARAEALEQEGRFREAAELTAKAMAQAHTDYVQSKVPGVTLVHDQLAPMAAPRHNAERYKARLRVDWQKWDRCSRIALPSDNNWGDGGQDDDDDDAAPDATADKNGSSLDACGDWRAATLASAEVSGGQIELVHSCCDGAKIKTMIEKPPEMPRRAHYLFNRETKSAVKMLLSGDAQLCENGRRYTHDEIARWLLTSGKVSKNKIGDYLGRSDDDATKLMASFLERLDFGRFTFDEALRFFLSLFRLPGEAQQIDRLMQAFANRYHATNSGFLNSADTAYVLAFSLIMLNTDAHSSQIEHKMTLAQFLNNNRGIDDGDDVPAKVMTELYHSIVKHEIRMEQREFIDSKKEGWLLKQGGRIKTWKKRYTILSGNVLFYFKSPKDQHPMGLVPLEGIEVGLRSDRRTFELKPNTAAGGVMKSLRLATGSKNKKGGCFSKNKTGGFTKGNHKSFVFRVINKQESTDEWVQAVEKHAVAHQVRETASVRSTNLEVSSLDSIDTKLSAFSFFRGKSKRRSAARKK